MLEIFSYSFMQRAFIIGNLVAIIAPIIGVFIVLKRLAMIGHTLSHVALAGVAIGLITGIYPVYTAILVTVFAGLGIEKLRRTYKDYAEISLAIILAAGLALATILISLSGNMAGIHSYLFGSISLITTRDIYIIIPLAILIIAIIFIFYYGFFFLAFSEQDSRLAGIPVRLLNFLFIILISLTVSLSMRVIGALLVSSLLTLPVATSLQIAKSFKATIAYAILFSILSVNTGLVISFYWDLAPGGTIIMIGVLYLLLVMTYNKIKAVIIN